MNSFATLLSRSSNGSFVAICFHSFQRLHLDDFRRAREPSRPRAVRHHHSGKRRGTCVACLRCFEISRRNSRCVTNGGQRKPEISEDVTLVISVMTYQKRPLLLSDVCKLFNASHQIQQLPAQWEHGFW